MHCFVFLLASLTANDNPPTLELGPEKAVHSITDWRKLEVRQLKIVNGGRLETGSCAIGSDRTTVNWVSVSGKGSWNAGGSLDVGATKDAALEIRGGAGVESTWCTIGSNKKVTGNLSVAERGSSWKVGDHLTVGRYGNGSILLTKGAHAKIGNWFTLGSSGIGELNLTDGASLDSGNWVDIGRYDGARGSATVKGEGTQWRIAAAFSIGECGTGELTIADRATVTNGSWARVGRRAKGVGRVTVRGKGSSWTVGHYAGIGDGGKGYLSISDGGSVRVKSRLVLGRSTGTGVVSVGNYGDLQVDDYLQIGSKTGHGDLTLASAEVAAGRIIVAAHGNVRGSGLITSARFTNGGDWHVASGESLRVVGDVVQEKTGTLRAVLGQPHERPMVSVRGDIDLAGTLHLSGKRGARIPGERSLLLLEATRIRGKFETVATDSSLAGVDVAVVYGPRQVKIRVTDSR